MPLTIKIPAQELYDHKARRFITVSEKILTFEHSLLSISKWEARWHESFMSMMTIKKPTPETEEKMRDYIRCMCLTNGVDDTVFYALDQKAVNQIRNYIEDPMTGTTFKKKEQKSSRKQIITNEIVYYWMTELNIPFDPCQKWHYNHLMALIQVASIEKEKQAPKKKGKRAERDAINRIAAENARRREMFHTNG